MVWGAGSSVPATDCQCEHQATDHRVSPVTGGRTSKSGASSPNTQTPWPAHCVPLTSLCAGACAHELNTNQLNLLWQNISVLYLILSASHLHHASLPADPEAAELIPGQNTWGGDADKGVAHLAQGNPGASVLPAPENDL